MEEDADFRPDFLDQLVPVLQRFGLTDRKLAVFDESDSESIARQICKELGVICEEYHVQVVAERIREVRALEPFAKRLRCGHQWEPLHENVLNDLKNLVTPAAVPVPVFTPPSVYTFPPRPPKHRSLDPDETKARDKHEREQKDTWARQLYIEMKSDWCTNTFGNGALCQTGAHSLSAFRKNTCLNLEEVYQNLEAMACLGSGYERRGGLLPSKCVGRIPFFTL